MLRTSLLFLFFTLGLFSPIPSQGGAGVACAYVISMEGDPIDPKSCQGSGFVIEKNDSQGKPIYQFITAGHLVLNQFGFKRGGFLKVRFPEGETLLLNMFSDQLLKATVQDENDQAVFSLNPEPFLKKYAKQLRDPSKPLKDSESVSIHGYPGAFRPDTFWTPQKGFSEGAEARIKCEFKPNSKTGENLKSAPDPLGPQIVAQGMSGGPILDDQGKVVGCFSRGTQYQQKQTIFFSFIPYKTLIGETGKFGFTPNEYLETQPKSESAKAEK